MIVAIVGPTGIGKTSLSIALAKHFQTEIISGDSIQVYKGLNIGSAKITPAEMDGIRHHLINILEPNEDYSVALFQQQVRTKIKAMEAKQLLPLIVGGTGLYIKSVLYDYNFTDAMRDPAFQDQFADWSNEDLFAKLVEVDPDAAETLHPNNRKRVLQAIQRSDSNKVSDNTNKDIPVYDFIMIGLRLPREELYPLLEQRVDDMIEAGLIEEVRALYDRGIRSNAIQAIGYKELYEWFDGNWTKEEAIERIKIHTRQLAKKQYTFFSNQFPIQWIDVHLDDFETTIQDAINLIEQELSHEKAIRRSI